MRHPGQRLAHRERHLRVVCDKGGIALRLGRAARPKARLNLVYGAQKLGRGRERVAERKTKQAAGRDAPARGSFNAHVDSVP